MKTAAKSPFSPTQNSSAKSILGTNITSSGKAVLPPRLRAISGLARQLGHKPFGAEPVLVLLGEEEIVSPNKKQDLLTRWQR